MASSMLSLDAAGLRRIGTQLRKTEPAVYKQLRKALLAEGRHIADAAKEKADWSTRIPATIKVSASGVATIVVRAGGKDAPHAKPYEHAGREGTFRHPVFPDPKRPRDEWTWTDKNSQARPFLHPAAIDRLPETVRAIGAAVITAVDSQIDKE